jgi:3'(2'), 5'-bisphosphate nucleotidase
MDHLARHQIALTFAAIALEAGQVIMSARSSAADVRTKADGSPVTQADFDADRVIRSRLEAALPGEVIVTEESYAAHRARPLPARFILVDPLDGTREFVSGRDEFTVNIALIEAGLPTAGAIYAPALSRLYIGGAQAYRADVAPGGAMPALNSMRRLTAHPVPENGLRAIASRSHLDPATKRWLDERGVVNLCTIGSSLKFCMIAEDEADVYPRLAPTMEWDTAAGQAILTAAGGCVLSLDGMPARYGKTAAGLRNDPFIAWGKRAAR